MLRVYATFSSRERLHLRVAGDTASACARSSRPLTAGLLGNPSRRRGRLLTPPEGFGYQARPRRRTWQLSTPLFMLRIDDPEHLSANTSLNIPARISVRQIQPVNIHTYRIVLALRVTYRTGIIRGSDSDSSAYKTFNRVRYAQTEPGAVRVRGASIRFGAVQCTTSRRPSSPMTESTVNSTASGSCCLGRVGKPQPAHKNPASSTSRD